MSSPVSAVKNHPQSLSRFLGKGGRGERATMFMGTSGAGS